MSEDNLEIREGKIDIKALQGVSGDGLEHWKPVVKASFALSADRLDAVVRALQIDVPSGAGSCDLDSSSRRLS